MQAGAAQELADVAALNESEKLDLDLRTDTDEAGGSEGDDDSPSDFQATRREISMLNACRRVECYERLNRISEGTYGVVYRCCLAPISTDFLSNAWQHMHDLMDVPGRLFTDGAGEKEPGCAACLVLGAVALPNVFTTCGQGTEGCMAAWHQPLPAVLPYETLEYDNLICISQFSA